MPRHKLSRRNKRAITTLVLGLLLLLAQQLGLFDQAQKQAVSIDPGYYRVLEIDDGDTIVVDMDGKSEKVRFIGVDTPETHDPRKSVQCFGVAATNFTKQLIGTNGVRLEADPLSTNRDRYNRLLRYIYLPDGKLVNKELVAQGYGFALTSFPFTKSEEFRQAGETARQENRGLWKDCRPTPNQYGGFNSNDVTP